MEYLSRKIIKTNIYPNKILQFGGGNFLRCFVNWMVQILNEETNFNAGVIIVKPTKPGDYKKLKLQDGLFTTVLEGIKNGNLVEEKRLIDCVQDIVNPYLEWQKYLNIAKKEDLRFVVSNTTEAGIKFNPKDKYNDKPPQEFPAKLAILLHHRYKYFNGDLSKGFIILPCELIESNGEELQKIILKYANFWELEDDFKNWILKANFFCNTLVDRIVSGYPKNQIIQIEKELQYQDKLVVSGEIYHSWIIQTQNPEIKKEIPFNKTDLNVNFVTNLDNYRTLKVRILNGAHTTLVPIGYLFGIDKVRESLEDVIVRKFLEDTIFNEICLTLDFSKKELDHFVNDVLDRFKNPYLEHELMSISLNSISKYKTRVLPSVLEYIRRKNKLPKNMLFSLAALFAFYKGIRNGKKIALKDDKKVLDFFTKLWGLYDEGNLKIESLTKTVLANTELWGIDLNKSNGLQVVVCHYLTNIINEGMVMALVNFDGQTDL